MKLCFLMPVYNDWAPAEQLIQKLDEVLAASSLHAHVVLVDDHSLQPPDADFLKQPLNAVSSVEIVRLRRNLGHQRAICIGLAHIQKNVPCDAAVIMDADGQDKPEDVPRLLQRFKDSGGSHIVFAERTKRLEPIVFRIGYHLYRALHWLLTGIPVRIGNFSVVATNHLGSLVVVPELWNHYAAAVLKARLPYETIPAARGARFGGKSHMRLVGLVVHGLSALSVFAEIVCVRLLLATLALLVVALGMIGVVVCVRLATDLAIPGWATYTGLLLLVLSVQLIGFAAGLSFLVLFNRNNMTFLPARDHGWFIDDVRRAR